MESSAVISPCSLYRYRLSRDIEPAVLEALGRGGLLQGKTVAFFGVNPSTADATLNDATVRKWMGFCARWGAPRFIVGNVFALRATDVQALATVDDPFGPDIGDHTTDIINAADILVPCWGNTDKVPPSLRFAFDVLMDALVSSGKPVLTFGLTASGDPKHPLMLGYSTPLVPWAEAAAA